MKKKKTKNNKKKIFEKNGKTTTFSLNLSFFCVINTNARKKNIEKRKQKQNVLLGCKRKYGFFFVKKEAIFHCNWMLDVMQDIFLSGSSITSTFAPQNAISSCIKKPFFCTNQVLYLIVSMIWRYIHNIDDR